tara:strand:+ start:151 stop:315 length:165 start_codon:yes stop_codon:yes gene_type:complete
MDNTPTKKYNPRHAEISNMLSETQRYENARGFVKAFLRLFNWRQIRAGKDRKIN